MIRRAARYVTGDHKRTSSVTAMIEDLKWPTLEERRAQAKVAMMYRIMNDLLDIPKQHLIPAGHVRTRGHNKKLSIPQTRTKTMLHSFFPDSIRLWNKLPQTAIDSLTLDGFKAEALRHKIRT